MNYAVYTHSMVDGQAECRVFAYKMDSENGVNGFHLMTKEEAQALADSFGSSVSTKMVLPLEPDQAITAF